jgi:hypothetical protein
MGKDNQQPTLVVVGTMVKKKGPEIQFKIISKYYKYTMLRLNQGLQFQI